MFRIVRLKFPLISIPSALPAVLLALGMSTAAHAGRPFRGSTGYVYQPTSYYVVPPALGYGPLFMYPPIYVYERPQFFSPAPRFAELPSARRLDFPPLVTQDDPLGSLDQSLLDESTLAPTRVLVQPRLIERAPTWYQPWYRGPGYGVRQWWE